MSRKTTDFFKWVKKQLGENLDKIDAVAEYDATLTLSENKNIFREKFNSLMVANQEIAKMTKREQIEREQKETAKQNLNHLQDRFKINIEVVS